MGYTQYNDSPITKDINLLYGDLLNIIPSTEEGLSLKELWNKCTKLNDKGYFDYISKHKEKLFDKNFHEISWGEKGEPNISDNFTKTARKRYDIAVLLTYQAAGIISSYKISGDYDDIIPKKLYISLKDNKLKESCLNLLNYIKEESIDVDGLSGKSLANIIELVCLRTINFLLNYQN